MPYLEIMPFFDTEKKLLGQKMYMPNLEERFKDEKYNGFTTYESSLLLNIDFHGEDGNSWKAFLVRAATPIRNVERQNPPKHNEDEKDEVTLFMEAYKETIKKNFPDIKVEDYEPLESMLRRKLHKHACYPKNFENIVNPHTLTFTLDFGPSLNWTLNFPNSELYTGIRYGKWLPSDSVPIHKSKISYEDVLHVASIPHDYRSFFFNKVRPSCDKLKRPIPIDAIRNPEKGKGNGEYFRDIMLSITDVTELVYELFQQIYFDKLRDLTTALYKGDFGFNDLNQSLENFVIIFNLHLIKKCLKQSKFDSDKNTPVVQYEDPILTIVEEHKCILSEYNTYACFPSASWIDKNSSKDATIIGAVGMRLSVEEIFYSLKKWRRFLKISEYKSSTNCQ